nr:hypothetical protein [uncultured Acetobacterium sp.]
MAVLLPLRFRILHLMSTKEAGVTSAEIMQELGSDYGKEKQFKKKAMEGHLISMRALGLIEVETVNVDENDELITSYKISDFGTGRLKFLPQAYK